MHNEGMSTPEQRYLQTYTTAFRAALAVTKTEDADIRIAKDRADATGAIIASAVKAGDAPDSWFKSKKIAAEAHNAAALRAIG